MDGIEFAADGNTIGVSVKRPDGLRRKWSEAFMDLCCEACGSENIDCHVNSTVFAVACLDCPNFNWKETENVLWYGKREEAFSAAPDYFEEV